MKEQEAPLTLRDIARQAGVSLATVDRVLHNRPGVRPETVRRVKEAVERNAFQPGPPKEAMVELLVLRGMGPEDDVHVPEVFPDLHHRVDHGVEDALIDKDLDNAVGIAACIRLHGRRVNKESQNQKCSKTQGAHRLPPIGTAPGRVASTLPPRGAYKRAALRRQYDTSGGQVCMRPSTV